MDKQPKMTNGMYNYGFEHNNGDVIQTKEPRTIFVEIKPAAAVENLHIDDATDGGGGGGGEKSRQQWGNGMEFLMSCIAMSVGLGNVWRFPFTAYENGGGAFLIPYIIVLVVVGRPLYYMEMALGQFCSRGNIKAYGAMAPALKGLGYAQLLATVCVATYYCSLMAITLFYLVNSFTGELPWSKCDPSWNLPTGMECVDSLKSANQTNASSGTGTDRVSSSQLYFEIEVLREKKNIEDGIGFPEWRLTLALFVGWVLTFIVSCKGVKSSGKASYFLAIFPYVIMLCLLVRALTLDGAFDGIAYLFEPRWEKLADAKVWYAAVTQCFFSLNVGFGTIVMYASYNNFDHNINRDAIYVAIMDTAASLLSGCTIFGILGNLAYELGESDIGKVAKSDTGLAFVSYPEAIAKFPTVAWLFAILFFFMLLILGVGSLVALQSNCNTVIMDQFPKLKTWHVSAGTAFAGFLIGLIYVTPGGQHMIKLVDHFGGTFAIFITVIIETIAVMWFYGIENFCLDMEFMLKRKVGIYWRITWALFTPVVLVFIFFYFLVTWKRLDYDGVQLPIPALVAGFAILLIAAIQVPLWMTYYLAKNRQLGPKKALKSAFTTENWGPRNPQTCAEWKAFKEHKLSKNMFRNESWLMHKIRIIFTTKD